MPPLSVIESDRTAAGDIFRAAFAYAIGSHYDLEKAIRIANIAAGLSTAKIGGKDSIPSLSEVIQNYESRFGTLEIVKKEEMTTNQERDLNNIQSNLTTQNQPSPASTPTNDLSSYHESASSPSLNEPFNDINNNQNSPSNL